MHVVAVLSEKGGAGKTTVTIHIAVAATLAGLDTVIIDLDPQASSADWGDRRGEGVSPEATAIPPARLKKLLGELRGNGVQMAVIDTGRDSNNAGYTAAQAADLVLIPCKPGGFDVQALNRTLNLCRLAGKRPYVVLNELHPGATRAEADMRESLLAIDGETKGRVYDCEICPVTLYRRTAYRNASITNKTAQETEPQSVAALEIGSLYKWINQQIALSTTRQFEKETI